MSDKPKAIFMKQNSQSFWINFIPAQISFQMCRETLLSWEEQSILMIVVILKNDASRKMLELGSFFPIAFVFCILS